MGSHTGCFGSFTISKVFSLALHMGLCKDLEGSLQPSNIHSLSNWGILLLDITSKEHHRGFPESNFSLAFEELVEPLGLRLHQTLVTSPQLQ